MVKLIGILIVVNVLAVWLALWLLPVYVLILASVLVNPIDWREVKWPLRVAALASGLPPGPRPARASANLRYPILAALRRPLRGLGPGPWCAAVDLIVGAGLRVIRRRSPKPRAGAA